jgi:flagellin
VAVQPNKKIQGSIMSLVINTNSIATVTRNYLNTNQANLKTSLSRLASGKRIVNPSDDAGGLAVGNKLAATLNRNTRAQQNVQNSISFLQVQDGALTQVGKILDRMSELKTMSLDVTKNASDIANYDAEFNQLQDQLSNIKEEKFNGINLFTTSASALTVYSTEVGDGVSKSTATQVDTLTISAGSAGAGVNTINVTVNGNSLATAIDHTADNATTATALATAINADGTLSALVTADASAADGSLTLTAATAGTAFTASSTSAGDVASANSTTTSVSTSVDLTRNNIYETGTAGTGLITSGSLDLLDSASATTNNLADYTVDDFVTFIQNGATARANNGAEMSRLEASHALLTTNHANIESARSRLMDVDIAIESTHFAKHNILVQSSAAMLSQANSLPNVALQLLG